MLDHAAIKRLLPHAHPMLLVDRIESLDPGRSIVGVKAISGCEPCYQHLPSGLAPTSYAYPVTLLLESFGQTAAILWLTGPGGRGLEKDHLLMLVAARRCRVERRVFPGDVCHHVARIEHASGDNVFVAGETLVGDCRVVHIESMMAVTRPRSSLRSTAPIAEPAMS